MRTHAMNISALDIARTMVVSVLVTFAGVATAVPVVEPLTWRSDAGPEVEPHAQDSRDAVLSYTVRSARGEDYAKDFPTRKLYEHEEMRDELAWMESFAPQRQRVKIRAVAQLGLPVLYPPYHWIPDGMRMHELVRMAESGGRSIVELWKLSQACVLCEDHSERDLITLFGLLNVQVFYERTFGEEFASSCCQPFANLVVELAADEQDVREIRMPMQEIEQGIYYVVDPVGIANDVRSEIVGLRTRPLMTVVGLEDTGYVPRRLHSINYAVRWGDLELEYGAHYHGDSEGVVR